MSPLATVALYALTALCEIVGCYLPMLRLAGRIGWWAYPVALAALSTFVWLLTLHPIASGRVYAAYGGIYIAMSIGWLWAVDRIRPTSWDVVGLLICVIGSLVIYFQPRATLTSVP